jgi:hypothetical protein
MHRDESTVRRAWGRLWPVDPEVACKELAAELPGWEISYQLAIVVAGRLSGQYVYRASRPRTGGHEAVECQHPDQLVRSIDQFCGVR